ncbi:restriction endonuclease subunit S [Novosphingobium percolationis]|uniref:restriction endonuclease subunit S n=1 Tax=Novosphingobium percolationis TaxID=2871811 RepID=UPI001CD29D4F|nr:restriction endonuclease subunit S [Novosphingobium percolationis]
MTAGVASIGDLIAQGHAQIQTGPFGSQLHSYDYVISGVPVVPTEAIRERRIDREVCPQISPDKASELTRHSLRAGDILFARRGVQATGHIGVVRLPEEGFICGTGAIRLRVASGSNVVCGEYLSHLLADPASISWFKFHAIGATMPNLNEGIIRDFPLKLPPYQYQRAIASILSALDDKIELNRRMNETLEAMAQAIFRDWFVDFGPVRRQQAGETDPVAIMGGLTPDPARAAELAALFPDAFDEDGLPIGWTEPSLASHVEIIGGGTPRTSNPAFWGGEIPWFSVVDTPSGSDVFVYSTEKSITAEGVAGSSVRLIPAGTTIISARGTVGNLAISAREMAFNQSCYALRSSKGDYNFFIYLLASHAVERLRAMAHGSVFSTITRQTFDAMSFPSPPLPILDALEALLGPMFDRIKASVAENHTLAETRDYLLPRLMSGEVRVGDLELESAA